MFRGYHLIFILVKYRLTNFGIQVKSIGDDKHIDHFCSELGWREFSYSQLYHNPDLPKKNLQPKFNSFPWAKDSEVLRAWEKGQTGIPMVDAGMRQNFGKLATCIIVYG